MTFFSSTMQLNEWLLHGYYYMAIWLHGYYNGYMAIWLHGYYMATTWLHGYYNGYYKHDAVE